MTDDNGIDYSKLPMSRESYGSRLTYEQIANLIAPLDPARVGHTQGQANMEAYDIRAELNRIFGFAGWDGEALQMELVREHWGQNKNGNPAVSVVYRCQYRLTVYSVTGERLATYTEWAMGDAANFPEFKYSDAHDFAAKTAESQALKRCAMNLGDQYGLCLYRGGSTNPVVNWTLAQTPPPPRPAMEMREDKTTVEVTPETDPDNPGQTDEVYEGPVLDGTEGQPKPAPGRLNRDMTREEWKNRFNEARASGPAVFVEFIKWCIQIKAPQPVMDSLEPTLNKLNNKALELGLDPVEFDFTPFQGDQPV